MGIDMPLYVLILVIVVILAALVFLIIRVFSSGKGDGGQDASASDSSKLSDSGKQLSLDIRYQGTSRHVTVNMDNPLRIGRNEQTLPLNPGDSDISRQHCQMFFRGDTLMLEDYSTNGTEVNQQSYHNGECAVHSGDTVKIGNHEITVWY